MKNRLTLAWTAAATTVASVLVVATVVGGGGTPPNAAGTPGATDRTTVASIAPVVDPDVEPPELPALESAPPDPGNLDVVVDASLSPHRAAIEPLVDGGEPRATGRIRSTEGVESDIVLDELHVSVRSDDELAALLERRNGEVIEAGEPDEFGDGFTDYLVRVDPATADIASLAANLAAFEDFHVGTMTVGDADVEALLAIAAEETARYGMLASPNWVETSTGIRDGNTDEWSTVALGGDDAFDYPWLQTGGPQDGGVTAAWQLIAGVGGIGNRSKLLIVDEGYFGNADLPSNTTTRKATWSKYGWGASDASGRGAFHGTHVIMAAAGTVDNGYGSAGPGAPVTDLIVMSGTSSTWARYRDIKRVVKDERPHVVNMSFGSTVTSFIRLNQWRVDRHFRTMRNDYGALLFASAGNDGRNIDAGNDLVLPCESNFVVCVGGVQGGIGREGDVALGRHPNSNYGTATGSGSVEIWGPYCTLGLQDPERPNHEELRWTCGTSFASPHVAGVATLVRAGNPTLSATEVWAIIRDTAHTDALGPEVTGSVRRVNAYRAVATAMGRPYTAPSFTQTSPEPGATFGQTDHVDLAGRFTNFADLDLPIQWTRPDGTPIGEPTTAPVVVGELPPGPNVFTATATDVFGNVAHAQVVVEVENVPPAVNITSPSANAYRYEPEEILLAGSTTDVDLLHAALPDEDVSWTVRREGSGDVVFTAVGHTATIPPSTLTAGDYEVLMRGVDAAGVTVGDSTLLTILAVPAGEDLPTVVMIAPLTGAGFTADGTADAIQLSATASDVQDGNLPGTRFRWVAAYEGHEIVLCEGGEVGGAAGTDCANAVVSLPLPPGAPENLQWEITVEAFDSANLPGRVTTFIEVGANVG
jgi:serine protease